MTVSSFCSFIYFLTVPFLSLEILACESIKSSSEGKAHSPSHTAFVLTVWFLVFCKISTKIYLWVGREYSYGYLSEWITLIRFCVKNIRSGRSQTEKPRQQKQKQRAKGLPCHSLDITHRLLCLQYWFISSQRERRQYRQKRCLANQWFLAIKAMIFCSWSELLPSSQDFFRALLLLLKRL